MHKTEQNTTAGTTTPEKLSDSPRSSPDVRECCRVCKFIIELCCDEHHYGLDHIPARSEPDLVPLPRIPGDTWPGSNQSNNLNSSKQVKKTGGAIYDEKAINAV